MLKTKILAGLASLALIGGAAAGPASAHYTTSQNDDLNYAINFALTNYCGHQANGYSCFSFDGWSQSNYTEHTRKQIIYWTSAGPFGSRMSCHSTVYLTHGVDRPDLDYAFC